MEENPNDRGLVQTTAKDPQNNFELSVTLLRALNALNLEEGDPANLNAIRT